MERLGNAKNLQHKSVLCSCQTTIGNQKLRPVKLEPWGSTWINMLAPAALPHCFWRSWLSCVLGALADRPRQNLWSAKLRVDFVSTSCLKILKRVWQKPAVSHDRSEEPRDMASLLLDRTTQLQSEEIWSDQRWISEHNTSDHPYVSSSQIASWDVGNHGFSFGTADHQLVPSLPLDFEDHLLSALMSLCLAVLCHVAWCGAYISICGLAWVPKLPMGRHPCNGCFLTYNCCSAHLKLRLRWCSS